MNYEFISVLIAGIALIASLIFSLFSFFITISHNSSSYALKKQFHNDIYMFLSCLESIILKCVLTSGLDYEDNNIDLELMKIRELLLSPSIWFVKQYLETVKNEKLFWSQCLIISCDLHTQSFSKNVYITLNNLTNSDIKKILKNIKASNKNYNNYISSLSGYDDLAIEKIDDHNTKKDNEFMDKLNYLKSKDINDPNIDLWLCLLTKDDIKLKILLDSNPHINVNITQKELLELYKTELQNFK